ncbi:MAG: TIGR02147 family protein [Pseudobdellovibrionaceae bacterium]
MSKKVVSTILNNAYKRLKSQNSAFSIRSVGKKLGMSHVAVGKLLKGESGLAPHRIEQVIKVFQLDSLASAELKEAVIFAKVGELQGALPQRTSRKKAQAKNDPSVYSEKSMKYFTALENWYELPILDLLTCSDPPKNSQEIAKKLGIRHDQAQNALSRLSAVGLIETENGTMKKKERYIRFPSKVPSQISRNYYRQILQKASTELNNCQQADFDRRLITNLCLAINPKKIEIAKARLHKALYEISLDLTDGEATQIYFLSGLLFPVSR